MKLFSNGEIDFKPLTEYVNWFMNTNHQQHNLIQLPPIQRNAVWNSQQVEKLWDSILRGFPIGSFLLAPRAKGNVTRTIDSSHQFISRDDGYFLLDGQQRTRAILLGFRSESHSRLWIDLNPSLDFNNAEFNDRQFLFRLLTSYQPWGMSDRNPNDKLSESEKYNARTECFGNSIRYDYQVTIADTWPIRSTLPVPFDGLIDLCGGIKDQFRHPNWVDVLRLIPQRYKHDEKAGPPAHFSMIVDALENMLSFEKRNSRSVVFLIQQGTLPTPSKVDVQDPMEVLFRRINSGGTVLAGEEMAYSLLKSSWDEAYDLVSRIVNDKKIGYLFSATGNVMAACRIVRFNLGERDEPNPSVSNFRRWIGEKETGIKSSFLTEMKDLMKVHNGKSKLQNVMEKFLDLAIYRGGDDLGLPRGLLLGLKPSILHPVLIWLYRQEDTGEKSRLNVLRYLMYAFLAIEDASQVKASKRAIDVLRNYAGAFPDHNIYQTWIMEDLGVQMPTIEQFELPFKKEADGYFRSWKELMDGDNDVSAGFRQLFWHKKEMLLWLQRKYHSNWFPGYNPMHNDTSDTPYDYDHILPYSHLVTSGVSANTFCNDDKLNGKFFTSRYLYINSIGNYRAWPRWANRSDSNLCHTQKLRMDLMDERTDAQGLELLFNTNAEYCHASIIPPSDIPMWKEARVSNGNIRDWPFERRFAWQRAVESRVQFLFKLVYNSFRFYEWAESTQ